MLLVLGNREKYWDHLQEIIKEFPDNVCVVGAYNTPKQTLLSGEMTVLNKISKEFKAKKIISVRPRVAAAFHSPIFTPVKEEFKQRLLEMDIQDP